MYVQQTLTSKYINNLANKDSTSTENTFIKIPPSDFVCHGPVEDLLSCKFVPVSGISLWIKIIQSEFTID